MIFPRSPSVNVSLFADDTKCFSTIESLSDARNLNTEFKNVQNWAHSWRLNFNAEKCKVLSITRKRYPIVAEYVIDARALQHVPSQKDLGVTVSSDLTWTIRIHEKITKANRMLGMLKRSTVHVRDASTRRSLYLALVRSHLAYASQVWSPQTVSMCGELENVQRRATKFVLALPFETDTRYKSRLLALNLLPLSYWHEYMDVLLLFKLTRGFISSDLNILPEQNNKLRMNLRSQNTTLLTHHIPKTKTLCYQNSYVVRASRIWNTLPDELRLPGISYHRFKSLLSQYYFTATKTTFDKDHSKSWKTICTKCHQARSLNTFKNCCF